MCECVRVCSGGVNDKGAPRSNISLRDPYNLKVPFMSSKTAGLRKKGSYKNIALYRCGLCCRSLQRMGKCKYGVHTTYRRMRDSIFYINVFACEFAQPHKKKKGGKRK